MAVNQNSLSPAIWNTLIRAHARGDIGAADLVSSVQNNELIQVGPVGAKMEKQGPGSFIVTFFRDGEQVGQTQATSPVAAKLHVLEWMGGQTKKVLEKEQQAHA